MELIGVVAIVASLIFVGLQLRQSKTATSVEFGQALSASEQEFANNETLHDFVSVEAPNGWPSTVGRSFLKSKIGIRLLLTRPADQRRHRQRFPIP